MKESISRLYNALIQAYEKANPVDLCITKDELEHTLKLFEER